MKCNNDKIKELLTAYLDNNLPLEQHELVEQHLSGCSDCLQELQVIKNMEETLDKTPLVDAPSGSEEKFIQMLKKEKKPDGRAVTITLNFSWRKVAAAAIIFIAGVTSGLIIQGRPTGSDASIASLESQVAQMRQVLMTALITNDSPSDRLKAVHYAEQIPQPSSQVTDILVNTLNNDPSVNVRLAAATALQQFAVHREIRTALAQSLQQQTDPMLQIVLIKMLVQMHEQSVVPTLQNFSTNKETHEMVKKEAEEALTVFL
ncbi:zf-HC2 domain-containing protein [Marinilabilia sp.]|uniref:zf-HC2 domain-containing protein n=1 Tax=Marinilabilia sp. TaxID=2021252 RepID=UPI0025C320F3|nr:zf-HC2 domain-containing protein [Marinilabilia sp.]